MAPTSSDSTAAALPRSARFVRGASFVNVIVGLAVFLAWVLDIDGLKSVLPGTVTMKANTALLFTISGAALWLAAARQDRRAVRALTAPPGRMGINTGIAFVFTGVALMLSAAGRLGAPWLALSSAALGAVSLISYAYSVEGRQLLLLPGEPVRAKLGLPPRLDRPRLSPQLHQLVYQRPADLILRGHAVCIQPAVPRRNTRFRRSSEYAAKAPPAREVPRPSTAYKRKTLYEMTALTGTDRSPEDCGEPRSRATNAAAIRSMAY